MIIGLNEKDNLKNINYLEIDDYLLDDNSELVYEDKSIYILHYPMGKEITVSYGYGITKKKEKIFDIIHYCYTIQCSSGSPIFNLATNKLIGIHKGCIKKNSSCYNIGSFLKYPLIEMQKKSQSNLNKINATINNNNKFIQNKINIPQIKNEKKHIKNINNEIPFDIYSKNQLHVKYLNNYNNEQYVGWCKKNNFDGLDNKNAKYSTNIDFYKNRSDNPIEHNFRKSAHDFNKIPNLMSNKRIKEGKFANINYNNRMNNNNILPFINQNKLPNDRYIIIININIII